jgi:SAM-dependent methyltransferase
MSNITIAPSDYRKAMIRRTHRRYEFSGRLVLPAVPSLLNEYVQMCDGLFRQIGVCFNSEELDCLRGALENELAIAFEASARSEIIISYDSPTGLIVNYLVKAQWQSLDARYEGWLNTRKPPLFGTEPDARVWKHALVAPNPSDLPVLDVGGGTGRNAIALSRRGHPVDVVELTPKFAQMIRDDASLESLTLRVIEADIFKANVDIGHNYWLMILSEVVSDFRAVHQLRHLFELAACRLAPDGCLVFNVFVVKDGFDLDGAAFELAQQFYSTFFTRQELAVAVSDLSLTLESDESVYEYEKTNLPAGAWPPTGWYADWVTGQDVFDVDRAASPIEMRWLVYRKQV